MAIRPTDLQSGLLQSVQTSALSARTEDAPRQAANAAQASFAQALSEREETVQGTAHVEGAKVRPKSDRDREQPARKRPHRPGEPYEDAAPAADDEPAHFIDFTA